MRGAAGLLLLFAAVGCHAGVITIRTQVRLRPAQVRSPEGLCHRACQPCQDATESLPSSALQRFIRCIRILLEDDLLFLQPQRAVADVSFCSSMLKKMRYLVLCVP